MLPLATGPSTTARTPDPAPLLEELATLRRENAALCAENAALRVENGALHERIRELEARLGQTSANSSRPPSSDPPEVPARPKAPPSGRKRGGQPGHRGVHRALLPVEQVDEVVLVVPEACRHCQQPLPASTGHRRGRVWRHQVVELLPLAVRVGVDPVWWTPEHWGRQSREKGSTCRRVTRHTRPRSGRRPFG